MEQNKFIHAQRLINFYLKELDNVLTPESQFAKQYSNLKLQEYRSSAVVDSLSSYQIKVK